MVTERPTELAADERGPDLTGDPPEDEGLRWLWLWREARRLGRRPEALLQGAAIAKPLFQFEPAQENKEEGRDMIFLLLFVVVLATLPVVFWQYRQEVEEEEETDGE